MDNRKETDIGVPAGNLANPYLDSQFKLIFNENVTREFLNSILKLKTPIREITIRNPESNDDSSAGRRVYFDVLCCDQQGNSFIVEMQSIWRDYLRNRILYYSCRKLDEMGRDYIREKRRGLHRGWKYDIRSVCTICLLNDTDRDLEEQTFIQDINMCDIRRGNVWSDKLRIIIVNLPMLKNHISEDNEYYLKFLSLLELISRNMNTAEELLSEIEKTSLNEEQKELFRRVVSISDLSAMSEEQRLKYEEDLKSYLDDRALKQDFFDKGVEQGIEKGRAEGRAEGKAEGRVEGEKSRSLQIAKAMKVNGISLDSIILCTGLTVEEVEML